MFILIFYHNIFMVIINLFHWITFFEFLVYECHLIFYTIDGWCSKLTRSQVYEFPF